MKAGLELRVIYTDEHLLELRVSAGNGSFSGTANILENLDAFKQLAVLLNGFPIEKGDTRTCEWGGGVGSVRFEFRCKDSAGHSQVTVSLCTDAAVDADTATIHIPVEAAAIDKFVDALSQMPSRLGGEVHLDGLPRS